MNKPVPTLKEYVSELVVDEVNTQRFALGLGLIETISDFSQLFVTVLTDSETSQAGVSATTVIEIDGRVKIADTDESHLVYIREIGEEPAAVVSRALTKALHDL